LQRAVGAGGVWPEKTNKQKTGRGLRLGRPMASCKQKRVEGCGGVVCGCSAPSVPAVCGLKIKGDGGVGCGLAFARYCHHQYRMV